MKYTFNSVPRAMSLLVLFILVINGGAAYARGPAVAPGVAQQIYLPLLLGGATNSTPRVGVVLDSARATHAAIGPEGGTLSASAANGVQFELTILPDALDFTETFTMTPASAVVDLPLSGGLVGAVNIEPAGLALYEVATLKISSATPPAGFQTVGFAYNDTGDQFHVRPLTTSATALQAQAAEPSVTIELLRLRPVGAARGTPQEVAALQSRPSPNDPIDALEQQLAAEQELREKALIDMFELVVRPTLTRAEINDRVADQAIVMFDHWLAWVDAFGLRPHVITQFADGKAMLRRVIDHAAQAAATRCYEQKRPEEGFAMQRWARYARKYLSSAEVAGIEAKLAKCLTFQVIFHSHMTEIESAMWGWQYDLHADFMLHAGVGTRAGGSGALAYDGVTWLGSILGCSLSGAGTGSTFDASGGLRLTPVSRTSAAVKIAFSYDPGVPGEAKRIICPIGGIDSTSNTTDWRTYYAQLHDYEQSATGFTTETTITGVGSFEGWIYHHTGAGSQGALTEDTQIEIKHMPER